MKIERVNIGLLIEQKMNELDITKSEMARRCGIANQNINRVLDKPSIDTDKLISISEALGFNFFDCFRSIDKINIAADNGGVAISGNGTAHHFTTNSSCDTAVLEERVKALEALLAEKERMIRLYEKMMNDKI